MTKFGDELFKYKDRCESSYFNSIWGKIKSVANLILKALIPEVEILEEAYDWGNVVYHSICYVQYYEDPDHHTDYELGY